MRLRHASVVLGLFCVFVEAASRTTNAHVPTIHSKLVGRVFLADDVHTKCERETLPRMSHVYIRPVTGIKVVDNPDVVADHKQYAKEALNRKETRVTEQLSTIVASKCYHAFGQSRLSDILVRPKRHWIDAGAGILATILLNHLHSKSVRSELEPLQNATRATHVAQEELLRLQLTTNLDRHVDRQLTDNFMDVKDMVTCLFHSTEMSHCSSELLWKTVDTVIEEHHLAPAGHVVFSPLSTVNAVDCSSDMSIIYSLCVLHASPDAAHDLAEVLDFGSYDEPTQRFFRIALPQYRISRRGEVAALNSFSSCKPAGAGTWVCSKEATSHPNCSEVAIEKCKVEYFSPTNDTCVKPFDGGVVITSLAKKALLSDPAGSKSTLRLSSSNVTFIRVPVNQTLEVCNQEFSSNRSDFRTIEVSDVLKGHISFESEALIKRVTNAESGGNLALRVRPGGGVEVIDDVIELLESSSTWLGSVIDAITGASTLTWVLVGCAVALTVIAGLSVVLWYMNVFAKLCGSNAGSTPTSHELRIVTQTTGGSQPSSSSDGGFHEVIL